MNHHMIREIREQPQAFARNMEERGRIREVAEKVWSKPARNYYIAGCGSSYYSAMIAAFYHEYVLGLNSRAMPSSEFVWYAPIPNLPSWMLIALSRSGRTSETVAASRKARKMKATVVAVTADSSSTMAHECDHCIDIGIGNEESTIMTKSFTASAFCSILLGLEFARLQRAPIPRVFEDKLDYLPEEAQSVIGAVEDQTKKTAEMMSGLSRFIYLGSGGNYASCLEGALKLRETSYTASETYHTLEFRHGPFAELQEGIGVVAVVPKGRAIQEWKMLLQEIASTGASLFPISDEREILDVYDNAIRMPESLTPEFAPLLFMIPMQLIAYYHAVKRGLNPDSPRNLSKYVKTEISQ
jgi:glucosamine--fructose-6-phosphate aminotransferase (isomerizing)